MFYILDLSFLLLSAIEFLRNSAIQVKFIIIIIIIIIMNYVFPQLELAGVNKDLFTASSSSRPEIHWTLMLLSQLSQIISVK